MKNSPLEGIHEAQGSPIGRDQDQLPVITELQAGPLTRALIGQLKRGKWTLEE